MTVAASLPVGLFVGGKCYREVELRSISGFDEAAVADASVGAWPAHIVSMILSRTLQRIGPVSPVPPGVSRELTVGDREAILLHMLRAIEGEKIRCVFSCPASGCNSPLEIEPAIEDLLVPPVDNVAPEYRIEMAEDGSVYDIRFRLPTGTDQELAAPVAARDPDAAARLILGRCVVEVLFDEEPVGLDRLPSPVLVEIEDQMRKLDPQADITLDVVCPDCGARSEAAFDAATFLVSELSGRARDLYREVHALALHYHWSEAEILGMHPSRRRRYLELLDEALEEAVHP